MGAQDNRFYNDMNKDTLSGETETQRHERLRAAGQAHNAGPEGDWAEVLRVFDAFDGRGSQAGLESREFKKVFDDCGLWDKRFTKNDVDTIFKKLCGNKAKVIDREQFKEALRIIADKKQCAILEVQQKVGSLQ